MLFLAEPSGGRATLTSLEKYLALHLGIILGTLAVTIIALVRSESDRAWHNLLNAVPCLKLPNEWPTGLQSTSDPNWHPLLRPVTAASLVVMTLLSYDSRSVGTLTTIVLLGSSVVGLLGLWMVGEISNLVLQSSVG